jgi:hypothetical protein
MKLSFLDSILFYERCSLKAHSRSSSVTHGWFRYVKFWQINSLSLKQIVYRFLLKVPQFFHSKFLQQPNRFDTRVMEREERIGINRGLPTMTVAQIALFLFILIASRIFDFKCQSYWIPLYNINWLPRDPIS